MENKDRLRHGIIALALFLWFACVVFCSAHLLRTNDEGVFGIITAIVCLIGGVYFAVTRGMRIIDK